MWGGGGVGGGRGGFGAKFAKLVQVRIHSQGLE